MGETTTFRAWRQAPSRHANDPRSTTHSWIRKSAQEGRRRKRDIKKGYRSLNVRLDERFALVDSIKESHTITLACEVFGVNRSSYKYWAKRSNQLSHEQVMLHSKIKSAFDKSKQSAGARTIATIVTARGINLSRYRASRLMKKLGLVSCQLPGHKYKKASQVHVNAPNKLENWMGADARLPNLCWSKGINNGLYYWLLQSS